MLFAPTLLFFAIGILSNVSIELTPEPSPGIKAFASGWGRTVGQASSSRSASRLDRLTPDERKKRAELLKPVTVTILSIGRSVEGLEAMKERIVDVRITNPNPYSIFLQGRQYKGNKTITPGWRTLKDGSGTLTAWDGCGTGVRDWEIAPNQAIEVMLYLHPELKQQQILGRFYKTDEPSIQSDCLLYKKK